MVYRTQLQALRGDPGLFSFLGKAVKAVGSVASFIPGVGSVVGAVANVAGGLLGGGGRPQAAPQILPSALPGGTSLIAARTAQLQMAGSKALSATGVAKAQAAMYGGRKGRRMTAGHAKPAPRAIRRIKAVRHLLQGIERELPRRPAIARRGSPGVITRAEAARALRA